MSISQQKMLSRYIKQAQSGDQNAFAALYNSLSMSAYYGALRMVKDQGDALTLTKEIMVELRRNLQALSDPDKLLNFVNRMVYLRSIDFLRREQRLSCPPDHEESKSRPEELEAALAFRYPGQVRHVLDAIDQLPDQYRAILLLYYYNGYSTREISTLLSWDEETTTVTFYRAHHALMLLLPVNKGGELT